MDALQMTAAEPVTAEPTADAGDAQPRAQRAFEDLRRAILAGEVPTDEPISQVQLAERMGISRTPLREALRMLEREGLIHSEPNRRVRVPGLTLEDLEEIYAGRIAIEALAVRITVPRMTDAELARLGPLLEAMDAAGEEFDMERWAIPHREFHDLLRAHSGERIKKLGRELADHSERYHRVHMAEPRSWSSAAREHEAIAACCREGDPAGAARELALHMARTPLSIITTAHPQHDTAIVRAALDTVIGEGAAGPRT